MRSNYKVDLSGADFAEANNLRTQQGFSLIELMITVAIVGILASIALPTYRDSVAKSRRAEARAILLEGSQWMERFYSENYRYDQNTAATPTLVNAAMPASLRQSPRDQGGAYTIAATATATTYTLTATRVSGGSMTSDKCGDFTITNTAIRSNVNHGFGTGNEAAAVAACWK